MINLFENYLEKEKDLCNSLNKAGYTHTTVVLNDDGYLPENITSPIQYFTQASSKYQKGTPKFFNELEVPYYWEIKGDGQKAEIFEGYKKKGRILYSQRRGDYRVVKAVEWLNEQEKVRSTDLYNQFGKLFGRKSYSDGQLILTTYFSEKNQEVLLFNHITGTIQVNFENTKYIFEKFVDFIMFYFEVSGLDYTKILYNSLAMPFFITQAFKAKYPQKIYQHTLFWQEISSSIPGNMSLLLNDKHSATTKIVIQDREEYLRIKQQAHERFDTKVQLNYLGYIYDLKERNPVARSVLIVTNSDQIANIEYLIEALPHHQFHIAARTAMSNRLLDYDKYSNVALYPAIEEKELEHLFQKNSFYFDINYGNEVEQVIRRAFENNKLIFAFKETLHNKRYICSENIFEMQQVNQFVQKILKVSQDVKEYRDVLAIQRWAAGQATVENYKEILK
ncbi:accessory Sec system glycosylation chaperone GtfB [Lactococcus sp. DD01]|uniref:accessory Sec system glycosylation chaperone GtfB n=1 Tax=Lactococcus sp. DD01 TaxID=1776443 RepID=UPI0007768D40|nr:accessory Sec system glycosylation chaperone GtfB [Lactococcus sp. DD01]KXT59353.1 Glycosyl transferase, family 8 [Lactococcus sp. DD01]